MGEAGAIIGWSAYEDVKAVAGSELRFGSWGHGLKTFLGGARISSAAGLRTGCVLITAASGEYSEYQEAACEVSAGFVHVCATGLSQWPLPGL